MATSTVDVHQLKKLRPLGALERFSSARHHLGFYHNVGISASYTHPSQDIHSLRDILFSALAVVINRHPILSAIPVDEDSAHPYFARLPPINLEEAVMFLTRRTTIQRNEADTELDSLLQDQHNLPFKNRYGELPFWRLIILLNPQPETGTGCEFTASFIFHHALGDGGSGMIFHKHFLSALLSQPASLTSTTIPSPSLPLTPNLELLHPCSIPSLDPPGLLPGLWSGSSITLPLTTQIHTLTLTPSTTTSFLTACRSNNTTLIATIPILLTHALSSLLPSKPTDFEACIPVNLRRFLPASLIDSEPIGVFIDAFSQYHTRPLSSSSGFWDEARRSKTALNEYLRNAGTEIHVARLGKVRDMREFFLSKVGGERGSSFDVSNLGGVGSVKEDLEEGMYEGWKMGRMVFSRSAFVSGSAFSTGLVTGPDGCLVFGFVWQEGVVERELIENVAGFVKGEIERIALEG